MIVAVCCAPGSSGVTTSAVALAAAWPAPTAAVVAELDASGGSLAAWFELAQEPGVLDVIATPGLLTPSVIVEHAQRIGSGLPVLVGPVRPSDAAAAVDAAPSSLLAVCRGSGELVLVADCGRLVAGDAAPVLGYVDVVLVVVRQQPLSAPATVGAVTQARLLAGWLSGFLGAGQVQLLVIGTDPYRPAEIAARLADLPGDGPALAGVLPVDPLGAAWLAGRPGPVKRSARSSLMRAARRVAAELRWPVSEAPGWAPPEGVG